MRHLVTDGVQHGVAFVVEAALRVGFQKCFQSLLGQLGIGLVQVEIRNVHVMRLGRQKRCLLRPGGEWVFPGEIVEMERCHQVILVFVVAIGEQEKDGIALLAPHVKRVYTFEQVSGAKV